MRNDFESTVNHIPQDKQTIAVEVPDGSPWIKLPLGNELLDAEFDRQSHNLMIETPAAKLVVEDYFASDHFPALLSETGKKIAGSSVETLAGQESPLEFAGPITAGSPAIGVVEKIKGGVTVTRDGQEVELAQGDPVFQQDVIKTDGEGSIGVTFEDGSVFTLGADARMTLDEFVYDPATGEGNSSVNVLKGMFKFVSGEIAANNPGDMQVETPVATIGIRGTTGGGSVQGEGADNQFYLEPNADGTVGWFDVTTAQGTVPMNQPNTVVGLTSFNDAPPAPQFVAPEQIQQNFAQVVDFAPAGKYQARQNNDAAPQNNPQQGADAPGNAAQGSQAGDNQETAGEPADAAAEGGDNAEQGAAAEDGGEASNEASEDNAADAKQESEQSAADSDVSANGEQSGEALDSFSGNENFDGDAAGGEAPKDAGAAESGDAGETTDAPQGDAASTGDAIDSEPSQEAAQVAEPAPTGELNPVAPTSPAPKPSGFESVTTLESATNTAMSGTTTVTATNDPLAPSTSQTSGTSSEPMTQTTTEPLTTQTVTNTGTVETFLQNQIANEQGLISEEGKILTPEEFEQKQLEEQKLAEQEQQEATKTEDPALQPKEGETAPPPPEGEETQTLEPLEPEPTLEPVEPKEGSPNTAPAFATTGDKISFAENSVSRVHKAEATDAQGDPFTYRLDAGKFDNDLFAIDSSGNLTFKNPPDYEDPLQNGLTDNEYKVEIIVRDDKGAETRKLVEVNVTDVVEVGPNNAPTFNVATANINVAENTAAATTIHTAAATDVDTSDTLSYSIVGGADNSKFTINPSTGELKFVASPDHEAPTDADGDNTYEVVIEVNDNNGGTAQQTVNVTVDDLAEGPTAITDSDAGANSVAEDVVNGATVGLTAQSTGATSYSLTDDAGGLFAIDPSTGVVTIADATLLDFETATSHSITVQATDGTTPVTQNFTINVTNVNEAPTAIIDTANGTNDYVAEDAVNGTTVGVIASSSDPESVTITYTLTDDAGGRFQIDAAGVITVADASLLDYETDTSHVITVQASDGVNVVTKNFTIAVGDVAEGPGDFTVTTSTADSYTGDAAANLIVVDDITKLNSDDSLDGGAGVDTLQIASTVATNSSLDLGSYTNIKDIESFDIDASNFTLKLDSSYLTRGATNLDMVTVDNDTNLMTLDLNGYQGGVKIAGTGQVDVLGAATEEQYLTNSAGVNLDLDLSMANSDVHVDLTAGNHSVLGGMGELSVHQNGAGHVTLNGGNSSSMDVHLENLDSASITASTGAMHHFSFKNSNLVNLNLSGSGDFTAIIDNSDDVTIDGSASTASLSDIMIEGASNNISLMSGSSGFNYHLSNFSGSAKFITNYNDFIYLDDLTSGADLTFVSAGGANNVTIDLNAEFMSWDDLVNIDVADFGGTSDLGLKLEFNNGRNLTFEDFYAPNGNKFNIFDGTNLVDLTGPEFTLEAMAEIDLSGSISSWAGSSFTIDDGTTSQAFDLVSSGGGSGIVLNTSDTLQSLDMIVSAINTSGLSGLEASHDGMGKIYLKTLGYSGTLPTVNVTAGSATATPFDFNRYFEGRGTPGTVHKEYGNTIVDGSVLDDHIMSVESGQTIDGGFGDDKLIAGEENTTLYGGDGDDLFERENGTGNNAADSVKFAGDAGIDTVDYTNIAGNFNIDLATNSASNGLLNDQLYDIEVVMTGAGMDTIVGGAGNQTIDGGAGADSLDGGAGDGDMLSYARSNVAVNVDLSTGAVSGGHAGDDTISGFENLDGSAYNDTLTGNAQGNLIHGRDGDDSLTGGDGSDTLIGGMGNDTIDLAESAAERDTVTLSNSGTDFIQSFDVMGPTNDVIDLSKLTGNSEENYFDLVASGKLQFSDSGGNAIISFNSSPVAELQGVAHTSLNWQHFVTDGQYQNDDGDDGAVDGTYTGSENADVMIANAASNTLNGFEGNDVLATGSVGSLTLDGGDGDDWIIYQNDTTLSHSYSLEGGEGFDTLMLEYGGPVNLNTLLSNNVIDNIEALHLNGNNLNTVTIANIEDFTGEHEMFIKGQGSETVNLNDANWDLASGTLPAHLEAHSGYTTYISEGTAPGQEVAIHVDNNITVNLNP